MIIDVQRAIAIVKKGGVVIFPTDTAYGIGCRIDDTAAVARLFALRKRPKEKATPVLVSSPAMAIPYFRSPLPDNVRRLMKIYWPGALTIVYQCQTERVTPLARGGGKTIGLRMPNHETTLSLIAGVGVPILGPSANFHGEKTPFGKEDLNPELVKHVDGVLEGTCSAGNVSTVLDCSVTPWHILRQGAVVLPEI